MRLFKFIWAFAVLLILKHAEARSQPNQYPPRVVPLARTSERITLETFNLWHDAYMQIEVSRSLGGELVLSEKELDVNDIIMEAKTLEYEEGLASPKLFNPSKHLFEVVDEIEYSSLFKIISDMPKGGVLHAHSTALCSTDYVVKLTYRKDLWACHGSDVLDIKSFKFSKKKPEAGKDGCNWKLFTDIRKSTGDEKVDEYLHDRFSLYPKTTYKDNNEVWGEFSGIFEIMSGLLKYKPVVEEYYYNALEEFYKDGVQYLELRASCSALYDMEGQEYTSLDTVRLYQETTQKFMEKNPGFIGAKLIYSPKRRTDEAKFEKYVNNFNELKKHFPDFVAGFDLVGQEEMGRPLKDFIPQLLALKDSNVNFYFHAGETNWFGSTVDENLIDAVLLGTKRIGHGYAVIKHPQVLKLIKENGIAVELNPLSNQILQLVRDLRNHPGSFLFSDNYPVVVSSDDPSFWKATPLSHDFYVAFLGIASAHADLKFLKKLALNSILYSAMSTDEQYEAIEKWREKWNEFIDKTLRNPPKIEMRARSGKGEKSEDNEKSEEVEVSEEVERSVSSEKSGKKEKTEKSEKSEKKKKTEKSGKGEKDDKSKKGEKSEKDRKSVKTQESKKSEDTQKSKESERNGTSEEKESEKSEEIEDNEKSEENEKNGTSEETEKSETSEQTDDIEKNGKKKKHEKSEKNGRSGKSLKNENITEKSKESEKNATSEKPEKSETSEKTDDSEKSGKKKKSEKSGKSGRSGKSLKIEESEISHDTEKSEESEKNGTSEEVEKSEDTEKAEDTKKSEKSGKTEKSEKNGKSEKSEKTEKTEKSGKSKKKEKKG